MTKQDDLSLLTPEVRGLVKAIDDLLWNAEQPNDAHYTWKSLRAELLRLYAIQNGLITRCENAEVEIAALHETAHYANGVADLAMKHRDTAEADLVFAKERIKAMELSTEELETEIATLYGDCPDKTLLDEKPTLILRTCGPVHTCPDGSEHDYSEWINLPDGSGTAVCIKCGHRAIDDAYWM